MSKKKKVAEKQQKNLKQISRKSTFTDLISKENFKKVKFSRNKLKLDKNISRKELQLKKTTKSIKSLNQQKS